VHDPTQVGGQGPDLGSQYRSAIFYHDEEQRALAEASKADEQEKYSMKIVTEIKTTGEYWRAEEYHQQYIAKGNPAACHF